MKSHDEATVEMLKRALSPRGNPTLKTLAAVCRAIGIRLDAHIA